LRKIVAGLHTAVVTYTEIDKGEQHPPPPDGATGESRGSEGEIIGFWGFIRIRCRG